MFDKSKLVRLKIQPIDTPLSFPYLDLIMSRESKLLMSEEVTHFNILAINVMELVGEKYVVWLNRLLLRFKEPTLENN